MNEKLKASYGAILREELVPAMGCTEPIAIAYAASCLRDTIGGMPDAVEASVSGNIIKNVKSVVVPNTGGLKGIEAAVAAGIVFGDAGRRLEVIAESNPEDLEALGAYMDKTPITVTCADTPRMLDITLTGRLGSDTATVHIANNHTNIVFISKNGETLLSRDVSDSPEDSLTDKSVLNVKDIVEYADTVGLDEIAPVIRRQIAYNSAIAEAGISGDWGANIGRVLMDTEPGDIRTQAKAYAAAGSDARMSGCELPVVIVSGSGNQGIAASVPVIRYAGALGVSEEKLIRALVVSDLVTIHQKTGIGRLSAYCGAVSAGCGAACGIAYLSGGGYDAVAHTIVNTLAIISGTICDGAKPSCAAKIASAVEAGLLGYQMYKSSQAFEGGDGILAGGVEKTIKNVGRLAREGMRETDKTILDIMLDQPE